MTRGTGSLSDGNQLSVFGRVGARPLSGAEQRKLYLRPDGGLWVFDDDPGDTYYKARYAGPPRPPVAPSGP